MLNEVQRNKFNIRAKETIQKLLKELKIVKLNDDNVCDLQNELDLRVSSLVSMQEDGETIDDKLLEIYDLLVDIVLDNEENIDFLNQLFLNW